MPDIFYTRECCVHGCEVQGQSKEENKLWYCEKHYTTEHLNEGFTPDQYAVTCAFKTCTIKKVVDYADRHSIQYCDKHENFETEMQAQSERSQLLHRAAEDTDGDRNDSHGSLVESFQTTAQLWQIYLNKRFPGHEMGAQLQDYDVAELMALLKTSRRLTGDARFEDHYRDNTAYVAIAYELKSAHKVI